jgi:hypothetical protein
MDVSGFWPIFGIACAGGVVIEFYKWWQLRESLNFPEYARSVAYWALTIGMILLGGGLAVLYGTDSKPALLVLNIGISAPAIIRTLAAKTPDENQRSRVERPSLRGFLAGG